MDPRQAFDGIFSLWADIAMAVFAAVTGTLVFAVVRYRARPGRRPSHQSKHPHTELVYLLALVGMALFLIVGSISANTTEKASSRPPALRVLVTGFQWCWQFQYLGHGITVRGTCMGSADVPTLVLPTGRTIQVQVTSNDVIHSIWFPHLRFKMDAFPRYVNSFTLDLHQRGTWPGRCAEYCGLYHSFMDFQLRVVSPSGFASWLRAHEPAGRAG